jgi:hypothetical protein
MRADPRGALGGEGGGEATSSPAHGNAFLRMRIPVCTRVCIYLQVCMDATTRNQSTTWMDLKHRLSNRGFEHVETLVSIVGLVAFQRRRFNIIIRRAVGCASSMSTHTQRHAMVAHILSLCLC